jgi:hypothetical protein
VSIEFLARPEYNLGILVHKGRIPDDEFLTFYKSLFESDSFDLSMNLLVDLREADSGPRSPEVLRKFAEFMRVTLANVTVRPRVAVIAPKDLSFGLARMYEVLADSVHWDFVVFRVMDAALAWLGVPEDLMNSGNKDAR